MRNDAPCDHRVLQRRRERGMRAQVALSKLPLRRRKTPRFERPSGLQLARQSRGVRPGSKTMPPLLLSSLAHHRLALPWMRARMRYRAATGDEAAQIR